MDPAFVADATMVGVWVIAFVLAVILFTRRPF